MTHWTYFRNVLNPWLTLSTLKELSRLPATNSVAGYSKEVLEPCMSSVSVSEDFLNRVLQDRP